MLPARRRAIVRTWTRRLLVLIATCLIAYLARKQIWADPRTVGGDAQNGIRYWEIARASYARGDGFPLWDRTECGGLPFLGNPEAPLLSAIVAGLFRVPGDAMWRGYGFVGLVVAMTGLYAWGRRVFALQPLSALFAAAVFGTSSFFAGQFVGHMSFVSFALLPWILLLARLGEDDVRAAVGAGALLAIGALEGGTYPVPYTVLALAITEGPRLLKPARALRVLRLTGLVLLTFALLAGAKLYPDLVELARHPRHFAETERQTWAELIPMFIDNRHGPFPGHMYAQDEYRAYVGPLAAGFAIAGAGAALILKPRQGEDVVLLLLGLLLARGRFAEAAPYSLLLKLPVFEQLRVPSRLVLIALLGLAIAAGVAFEAAMTLVAKGRPHLKLVLIGVGLVAIYDPILASQGCHKLWLTDPALPNAAIATGPYAYTDGRDFGRSAEYPARNQGAVGCAFKPWDFPEAQGLPVGSAQIAALAPGAGVVSRVEVRQNAFTIDLDASRPATLHVRGAFDPDWTSNLGKPKRALNGQLELTVPAGKQTVTLRYRPVAAIVGAIASGVGVIFAAGVMVLARRRRRVGSPRARVAPPGAVPTAA